MQLPRTLRTPHSIRPWTRRIAIRTALMLLIPLAGLGPLPAQAQSVAA